MGSSIPSIVHQDRKPDRLVIVNDGIPFTDQQESDVINTTFPLPVTILPNKRTPGMSGALNTGIEFAASIFRHAYLAILDDDDSWDATHLDVNYRAAHVAGLPISISGLRLIIDGMEHRRPVTIPRQSRGLSLCEPLKAAKQGR